jgi:PAS domain S-box-containing protein
MAPETLPAHGSAVDGRAGFLARVRLNLPEGRELPENQWRARHRAVLVVILAHAVGLPVFGLWRGWSPLLAVGEGLLILLLGGLAALPSLGRRFRSSVAALALVTSSAVLVQFWGGYIEGHFHFFVVVAIVSLYQDWVPFLLAIVYVAVDHGGIGTVAPDWVYRNEDAVAHPWRWAVIHAAFVLAECVALLAAWRAAEQARAHAEMVLASSGDGMLGVGADGRVSFANPAAATLVGRTPGELVGLQIGEVMPHVSVASVSGGAPRVAEDTLQRPDGSELPIEAVVTPMRGGQGGSVVALKDLTERRKVEEERMQSAARQGELARLREQDAFKTLFINTAAHELRTPMTPIKVHIHVLESGKRGPLNAEQKRTVDVLKRNLERLGVLIEDVLNVSRLQAGHLTLERRPMALEPVLREAAQTFQPMAEKAGLALELDVAPDVQVSGDPKRLSQVLFNLVDNAFKFTPPGGRVSIRLHAERGWAEVEVRDTGKGLTPADMAKLFQPFSQVHDTMQTTRSGSGLGLYISRGIAELHGGTLRVESAGPGLGSTFTFTLPLLAGDGRGAASA